MPETNVTFDEAEHLLYRYAAFVCIDRWCCQHGADDELTVSLKMLLVEALDAVLPKSGDQTPEAKAARLESDAFLAEHLGRDVGTLQQTAQAEMDHSFQEVERLFDAAFADDELGEDPRWKCYHQFRAIKDHPLPLSGSQRRAETLVAHARKAIACLRETGGLAGGGERTERAIHPSNPGLDNDGESVLLKSKADYSFAADKIEMQVLEALDRHRRPAILNEVRILVNDLSNQLYSTKTIGDRLKNLEGQGFVERPRGRNRGVRITQGGSEFLQRQKLVRERPDR